jgi:hypothetical protein
MILVNYYQVGHTRGKENSKLNGEVKFKIAFLREN